MRGEQLIKTLKNLQTVRGNVFKEVPEALRKYHPDTGVGADAPVLLDKFKQLLKGDSATFPTFIAGQGYKTLNINRPEELFTRWSEKSPDAGQLLGLLANIGKKARGETKELTRLLSNQRAFAVGAKPKLGQLLDA